MPRSSIFQCCKGSWARPQDELGGVVVVEQAGQLVGELAVNLLGDVGHLQLLVDLRASAPASAQATLSPNISLTL